MAATHPSRRSGFAGLRLVDDVPDEQPESPPFTFTISVDGGTVAVDWDPKTPDVKLDLLCLIDVVSAVVLALESDQDVNGRAQRAYDMRVQWRDDAARRLAEHEASHPWLCACGKRCKTSAGLDAHRRAGNPRCAE